MSLPQLHAGLANAMLLYFTSLAFWGAFTFFVNREVSASYWGAVTIATYLAILQAVIGVALLLLVSGPRDSVHFLYGITALLAFPAARLYTANRSPRAQLIILTLVAFFLVGVAIRGIGTGR